MSFKKVAMNSHNVVVRIVTDLCSIGLHSAREITLRLTQSRFNLEEMNVYYVWNLKWENEVDADRLCLQFYIVKIHYIFID